MDSWMVVQQTVAKIILSNPNDFQGIHKGVMIMNLEEYEGS